MAGTPVRVRRWGRVPAKAKRPIGRPAGSNPAPCTTGRLDGGGSSAPGRRLSGSATRRVSGAVPRGLTGRLPWRQGTTRGVAAAHLAQAGRCGFESRRVGRRLFRWRLKVNGVLHVRRAEPAGSAGTWGAGPCVVGPDKSRRFGNEAGCGCPAPVRGRRRRPHNALLWGSNPPFRAIGWPTMLRVVFAPAGRTVVGESQVTPLRPARSGSTSRGTPGASGDACARPPDWLRTRR